MSTIRSWSGGASSWAATRPSRRARLGAFALLAAGTLLGLIVLVPLMLLGAMVAILGFLYVLIRRVLVGAREPNGALDGRRNVRVIDPAERVSESEG
ncbi:hypothetical protein PHYC_00790 [Phycisphaerales bacterium]|nr:hypothetical protein PHYC_00790 [Phycisphaerales bacterium]